MPYTSFTLFSAGLAALASSAAAWTQPQGDAPEGNAILTPGLHEVVPAGQSYTITWDPSTKGTVDLVLLKGPSSQAVPQYAIAQGIDNSGSYTWTPSTDLVPTGDQGYGIELIDTATGQYQYSTQFGISNKNAAAGSSSSSASSASPVSSASASVSTVVRVADAASQTTTAAASSTSSSSVAVASDSAPSTTAVSASISTSLSLVADSYPSASASVAASSTFKTSVASGAAFPTGLSGNSSSHSQSPAFNGAGSLVSSLLGAAVAAGIALMAM